MPSNPLYFAGCQISTDEESKYFPPELVSHCANDTETVYYCYVVDLQHDSYSSYQLRGIVLAVRTRLKFDDERLTFDLDVDKGSLLVQVNYSGVVRLTSEEVTIIFMTFILSLLVTCKKVGNTFYILSPDFTMSEVSSQSIQNSS